MASSNGRIDKPQHRCQTKRAELPNVNINTGMQSINTERVPLRCLRLMYEMKIAQTPLNDGIFLLFKLKFDCSFQNPVFSILITLENLIYFNLVIFTIQKRYLLVFILSTSCLNFKDFVF